MNVAAIQRAGKAVAVVQRVCQLFEHIHNQTIIQFLLLGMIFFYQGDELFVFMTLCNRQQNLIVEF